MKLNLHTKIKHLIIIQKLICNFYNKIIMIYKHDEYISTNLEWKYFEGKKSQLDQ